MHESNLPSGVVWRGRGQALSRAIAGLLTIVGAAGAWAQPEASDAAPAASASAGQMPPTAEAPIPDMLLLTSDGLAQMALGILRNQSSPTEADYRITALALRMAQRLRGNTPDEELLRLERDAWQSASDEARALDLTRQIIRVNPDDQVSLMRLLTDRIRALQDADQRLAAYDKLLGPEGKALSVSIRSRLALDSALIARETGDEAGFLARLTEATTLDVTNKEAAVLHATYLLDQTQDAQERADLLGNVILSDPTDKGAYTNLAMEMLSKGAFRGAARFFNCATSLTVASGEILSTDEIFDRYLVTWLEEGDEACEKQLQDMQNQHQVMVMGARQDMERQGLDPDEIKDAKLPTRFEMLRLAIAFANGDQAGVERSILSLEESTNDLIAEFERSSDRTKDLTPEQLSNGIRRARTDLVFARLWAGLQLEDAEADLQLLEAEEGARTIDQSAIERFRAMLAVRNGDVEVGIARLEAMGPTDTAALLGIAIALESLGKREEAIRAYARLALDNMTSAIGAASRKRVETLLGQPLAPSPTAFALDAWATNFAPWLDTFVEGPRRFMSLTAKHVRSQIDVFDRAEVEIRLRNTSRWPLALGPDSAINSRFLVTPLITVAGKNTLEMAAPEITELDQKLRLNPREEISRVMWINRGPVGTLMLLTSTRTTKMRWRALQGYHMDPEAGFVNGPLTLTAETDLLSVYTLKAMTEAEVQTAIREAHGRALLEAFVVASGLGATRKPGETEAQNLSRRTGITTAIVDRFPEMTELEQVWAMTLALPAGLYHASTLLVDVAQTSPSPFVKAVLLVGPYRGLEVAEVVDFTNDEDPDVAEIARLVMDIRERAKQAMQ